MVQTHSLKQHLLLVFTLLFVSVARGESIPPVYKSDISWLSASFKEAVKNLNKLDAESVNINQIIDALDDTLARRMLPSLYNKSLTLERWKSIRAKMLKEQRSVKEIDVAIADYNAQISFISNEIRKNGYSEIWKASQSNHTNLRAIILPLNCKFADDRVYIAMDSRGLASCDEMPADRRAYIYKSMQARVTNKHAGNVRAFYERTVSRLTWIGRAIGAISILPSYVPGAPKNDVSF